jgi:rod shape determining protein RodA
LATLTIPWRREGSQSLRHIDAPLLVATFALMATGTTLVYLATSQKLAFLGHDPLYYLKRDAIYMIAGSLALVVSAAIDYRTWKGFTPFLYGGTVLALLAVLSPLGSRTFGAKSWFSFPLFQVEPSELAKPAMILVIALVVAERRGEVEMRDIGRCLALIAVPAFLVFIQPELGTMLVLVAIMFVILLVGGARPRDLLWLLLGGVVVVTLMFQVGALRDYQKKRLTAFVAQTDQVTDPDGPGYNVAQAKQAISNGGLFGRGPHNSTQTNLGFVPVQESDFIFTVMGEEFGFVGCLVLLVFFGILIWRGLRIASVARDHFGALVAAGVVGMFVFQMFVNVGMTLGIMPVTGIPLPLVSFGGSALIGNCICVGLLLNIHMRRFQ